MFIPDHKHLIVQGFINKQIKKEEEINEWLENLVKTVRMQVVAGPVSKFRKNGKNRNCFLNI